MQGLIKKPRPGPTLLEMYAPKDGVPLPDPWWRDGVQVVNAAMKWAAQDASALRRLRYLIAERAKLDEGFRRELMGELAEIGKSAPGGRGGRPSDLGLAREALLVDEVGAARESGLTIEQACERLLRFQPDRYQGSVEALVKRYARAKRKGLGLFYGTKPG